MFGNTLRVSALVEDFMFPIPAADYGDGVDGNKRPRTTITARQMEVREALMKILNINNNVDNIADRS